MNDLAKIALGTWSWGAGFAGGDQVFGNQLSDEQMQAVFDEAVKQGLTLWDTAAVYGMGSSETALGKVIKDYGDKVQISTKFTPQIADENAQNPVQKMLDESKARLGRQVIDLYWIHNPHDVARWTPYLVDLVKSGQVKAIGVSNHSLTQIKEVNDILSEYGLKINAVQNHFSLLYRASEQAGILDYCRQNGITFFAYMVLEQGALSGRYSPDNPMPEGSGRGQTYNQALPALAKLTDKMREIGQAQQASVAQVAIAYALAKGTIPLIGATKVHHITDAKNATLLSLSPSQIDELERLADETQVNTQGSWEGDMA